MHDLRSPPRGLPLATRAKGAYAPAPMALFNKRNNGPEALKPLSDLRPLSKARVQSALTENEWKHGVDDDGDIAASFDGHPMWFICSGESSEMLQIVFRHAHNFEAADLPKLLGFIQDWNASKLFPRAYYRESSDGEIMLFADLNADFEKGVSDAQLRYQLGIAVSTSMQLAGAADEVFGLPPSGEDG